MLGRRRNERGSVVVLTSISMVMMVGISALVVDIGNARQVSRGAQAAADSAALAGAQEIMNASSWTTVVSRVKRYSDFNGDSTAASWVNCFDPKAASQFGINAFYPDIVNNNTCISADKAINPTQFRIALPKTKVKTAFASMFGTSALDVSRSATATVGGAAPAIVTTTT